MVRSASFFSTATSLLLAAFAGAWLAVVALLELVTGYEHDPSVAAPSPDAGGVLLAVGLIALSHVAPRVLFARGTRRLRPRTTLVFGEATSYRSAVPVTVRPIDEAAWRDARESRASGAAAVGLAALVAVALEGLFLGQSTLCFHCYGDLPWRRSLLDSTLYVALAVVAAISHAVVARWRRAT